MTTYVATIRHSSISRDREIKIQGGFVDHEIVIVTDDAEYPEVVSSRRIGDCRWSDRW